MIHILFFTVVAGLILIEWRTKTMAQTLAELQSAITELGSTIEADKAQVGQLIVAVNALIAKIEGTPAAQDFTNEIAAIGAIAASITGDNVAIQEAIDKAATKSA